MVELFGCDAFAGQHDIGIVCRASMTSASFAGSRRTFAIGDLLWGFLRLCIVQEALKDSLRAPRYIVPHHGGDLLGALKWLGFRDRISCCYNRVTVDSDAV